MRQMSIPDLAQKLDQAESTFGQVHPQVRPPAKQPRKLPVNLCMHKMVLESDFVFSQVLSFNVYSVANFH